METRRLDLNAVQVTTFEVGSLAKPEAAGLDMSGGTGVCYTCRFTVCQETRHDL